MTDSKQENAAAQPAKTSGIVKMQTDQTKASTIKYIGWYAEGAYPALGVNKAGEQRENTKQVDEKRAEITDKEDEKAAKGAKHDSATAFAEPEEAVHCACKTS